MNEGTKQKGKAKIQSSGLGTKESQLRGTLKEMEKAILEEFPESDRVQVWVAAFYAVPMASGMSILRRVDKTDMLQTIWESSRKLCSAWIQIRSKLFKKGRFQIWVWKDMSWRYTVQPLKKQTWECESHLCVVLKHLEFLRKEQHDLNSMSGRLTWQW